MTQLAASSKPVSSVRRATRCRRRILRIAVCIVLAHALATTTAILLSIQQLSRNAATRTLAERRGSDIVETGLLRTSLGIDRYNLILRPTPFDPSPPPIITHDPARQRFLESAPRWVQRQLPGQGQPHIPDTFQAAGINTIAIGWPIRMYRATNAHWVDNAHHEAFQNSPGTLRTVQTHADTPFACPIIHGTIGLVSTGPYLGQTHWGSIESRHITDPLPNFITNRLTLPPELPITPIWFGTLINTVLFAILIILTHKAATTLRRHLKHRQNPNAIPCPNCGYDLNGITTNQCPECGEQASVNPKQTVATSEPARE